MLKVNKNILAYLTVPKYCRKEDFGGFWLEMDDG